MPNAQSFSTANYKTFCLFGYRPHRHFKKEKPIHWKRKKEREIDHDERAFLLVCLQVCVRERASVMQCSCFLHLLCVLCIVWVCLSESLAKRHSCAKRTLLDWLRGEALFTTSLSLSIYLNLPLSLFTTSLSLPLYLNLPLSLFTTSLSLPFYLNLPLSLFYLYNVKLQRTLLLFLPPPLFKRGKNKIWRRSPSDGCWLKWTFITSSFQLGGSPVDRKERREEDKQSDEQSLRCFSKVVSLIWLVWERDTGW